MTAAAVSAVLVIDVSPAIDEFGILEVATAAKLLPIVPAGVPVRLDIGSAVAVDSPLGILADTLRRARCVEVIGSNAAGVAAIRTRLARAFATTRIGGASA